MDYVSTIWTLDGLDYYEFRNDDIFIHRLTGDENAVEIAPTDDQHHWLLLDDDKDKYKAGGDDGTKEILEC